MMTLLLALLLFATPAFAQAPPPLSDPEVDKVLAQIHQAGCNAEAQASAQYIAQLQKENADLKKQIMKLDPPKSGATKK